MKNLELTICLTIFTLIFGTAGQAVSQEVSRKVAVAMLTLPPDSDGLLHWRAEAKSDTAQLQLSTRYFSLPMKVNGNVIQFFAHPLAAKAPPPLPKPLLTVALPPDAGLFYIVLWAAPGQDGQPDWRSRIFNAKDWSMNTLKLLNGCTEDLGIIAATKKIAFPKGESVDFKASEWSESFPIQIFRASLGTKKPIFSSTWRVSKGSRELCFLFDRGKTVSIRSLIDLAPPPPASPPPP